MQEPRQGILKRRRQLKRDALPTLVPYIAVLSPVISYLLNLYSEELFFGYKFGFEILIVNGLITFMALLAISKKTVNNQNEIP